MKAKLVKSADPVGHSIVFLLTNPMIGNTDWASFVCLDSIEALIRYQLFYNALQEVQMDLTSWCLSNK